MEGVWLARSADVLGQVFQDHTPRKNTVRKECEVRWRWTFSHVQVTPKAFDPASICGSSITRSGTKLHDVTSIAPDEETKGEHYRDPVSSLLNEVIDKFRGSIFVLNTADTEMTSRSGRPVVQHRVDDVTKAGDQSCDCSNATASDQVTNHVTAPMQLPLISLHIKSPAPANKPLLSTCLKGHTPSSGTSQAFINGSG
ncbi:hypothetical protein EMCRGX_G026152 [Ephydatia muelleri]